MGQTWNRKCRLIVEDDAGIREIMEIILSLEGHCVTSLEDGNEVNRRIEENRPDVVMMDIMLGDLTAGIFAAF